MLNERSLTKAEEKRKEEIVKDLKSNKHEFKKRYGKDAERVMYGTAVKRAKKQVKEMNENRIKEAVKAALMKKEGVKEERMEFFEPEDYEAMRDLQDASAMMDAIEDLYKKAKALGYGPDVKKLVADLDEELKNPEAADRNRDGKLSSWEEKVGAAIEKAMAKKDMKEAEAGQVTTKDPAQAEMLAKKGVDVELTKEDMSKYKVGDKVKYKGMNHEITRIVDDKIYIKNLKYSGRPDTWVKDIDLKKSVKEDLDLGHEDNEPHMIKGELYRIGKYAMELYQMVDQFEGMGEVDFPAWWQAMITDAASKMSKAKHYLEFELREPEIDAMVDVAAAEDIIPNVPTEPLANEIEEGLPKGFWDKKMKAKDETNESYETLVKKIKGQGESTKAAKAIAGAVAAYKRKGGGKGPTAKQKK